MATVTENLNKIVAAKTSIQNALANKGVPYTGGYFFMPYYIKLIPTSGGGLKIPVGPCITSAFSQNYLDNEKVSGWSSYDFLGRNIWSDGTNIYLSEGTSQYVFNKSNQTWSTKTWTGLTNFLGRDIWTDGYSIYYSSGTTQYVLNTSNSTWSTKTWTGLTNFSGRYIWMIPSNAPGAEKIYYSNGTSQYKLTISSSTWYTQTWGGLTNFDGECTWSDGTNIYYSKKTAQYILNQSNNTWSTKTWNINVSGWSVWSDGEFIYDSDGEQSRHYVLQNGSWVSQNFTYKGFGGADVWTDGTNIYASYDVDHQYKFKYIGQGAIRNFPRVKTSIY